MKAVRLVPAVAVALAAACSGKQHIVSSGGTTGASDAAATGSASSSAASGQGGGLQISGGSASGGAGGSGGVMACAAAPFQATQLPLDMYVMLDQSGSMDDQTAAGPTKWEAVTKAIGAFVSQPGTDGISIGIQYFGLPPGGGMGPCPPLCFKDADCGANGPCVALQCAKCGGLGGDSCNADDYAKPEVEIGALPGVGAAIQSSLAMHKPATSTPTSAALDGALQHATAWAIAHPGHVAIAVLATDGEPTECDTNVDDIAAHAAAALASKPSIKTFTIGVFAPQDIPSGPDALKKISAAGGTMPFTIDTNNPNVDVEKQFLAALNAIRGSALGCQYQIPKPKMGVADFTQLNVDYTKGGMGMPETIPNYPDLAHCPKQGDGWYYDDPAKPTQVILCPKTCDKVSADPMGKVEILLGCKTVVGNPG